MNPAETQAFVINFQGRIVNDTIPDTAFAAKSSQISTLGMTFRLFDAAVGGTQLWSEFWPAVQVGADGTFNVLLGSVTAIDTALRPGWEDNGNFHHLEIQVSGDQAMTPRIPIVSSPHAIVGASLHSPGPGNELIDIDWFNGLVMIDAAGDTSVRLDLGSGLGSVQNLRVAGQGYFGPDDWPGVIVFGGGIGIGGGGLDPTVAFDTMGTGRLGNIRIGQNGYWGPDEWPGVVIGPGGIVIGGGGVDPTVAFDTMGIAQMGNLFVSQQGYFGPDGAPNIILGPGGIVIGPGGIDTTIAMPSSGMAKFRGGIHVSPRARFAGDGPTWLHVDTGGVFGGLFVNDTTIKVSSSGTSYFASDVGFGGAGYYGDSVDGWIRIETPHGIKIIAPGGADTTVALYGSGVARFRNLLVGLANSASGSYSSASGYLNSADGNISMAAGTRAKAVHKGAFVWADSGGFDFASTAVNQFSARCTGGARFVSAVNFVGTPTAGVTLAAGGGSWSSISDLNAKENVAPVAARDLLERLAQIPISTWNYTSQDPSIRHIGPMAQDFHAAFGVGEDDTHITTIDADGVALAAIQELYRITQDLKARDAEVALLQSKIQRLEELIVSRLSDVGQTQGGGQ